jgi:hypothetical protein
MKMPLQLPPEVARRFINDMRAFYAEPNAIKRDFIAGRQLQALRLRITDIFEMFQEMRDQV